MRWALDLRTFLLLPTPHIKLGISVNGEIMNQGEKMHPSSRRENKKVFVSWHGLWVEKKPSPLRVYRYESSHGFGVEIYSACMVLKSSTLKRFQISQTLRGTWKKQTQISLETLNLACTRRNSTERVLTIPC